MMVFVIDHCCKVVCFLLFCEKIILMKKYSSLVLLIVLFLAGSNQMRAQQNVYVKEATIVSRMMFHLGQQNQLNEYVSGWRIQILATTDRQMLEKVKAEFQRDYPGMLVDWQHDKPYYKLRAGAFASKLEATELLYRLKKKFPSAYPAKDNQIAARQLLGY